MKEYIKVLETIKQQYESALDDGQNSTDIDAIEAVEDNALAIEALNMATQALIDFPAMLKQYLGENDQMIIGKDVYEELKYELETLKKNAEPQEWISVKDRLPKDAEAVLITIRRMDKSFNQIPFISVGYISWNQQAWWCAHDGDCKENNIEVLAWMPLPSPYKGE